MPLAVPELNSPTFILTALVAYLLGSIPTGVIVSRLKAGVDIQSQGSGNIGATNVTRILGIRLGAMTLLGDAVKGFVPTLVALLVWDDVKLASYIGLAAFVGHCHSIFLGMKGGKGVAVALGDFLALTPMVVPLGLVVWAIVFGRFRKSSLASLIAAPMLLGAAAGVERYRPALPSMIAMVVLIFWRHRGNIERLKAGTEL